ncbi:MAG: sigma-70 family RNA polymerase sigma factor [Clostridiales bacterium]|nr:sigma-70 family RNA polymerase sigma factor [Clostridiales bacterium]
MDNGDPKAFWDALYAQYYPVLFRYCKASLARDEDAASECAHRVFEIALQKAESLQTHPRIGGWLMNTAKHQIAKYRSAATVALPARTDLAGYDPYPQIDGQIDEAALLARLRSRLYTLFYIEGQTQVQIARALGVSTNVVKKRMQRLRIQLRKLAGY